MKIKAARGSITRPLGPITMACNYGANWQQSLNNHIMPIFKSIRKPFGLFLSILVGYLRTYLNSHLPIWLAIGHFYRFWALYLTKISSNYDFKSLMGRLITRKGHKIDKLGQEKIESNSLKIDRRIEKFWPIRPPIRPIFGPFFGLLANLTELILFHVKYHQLVKSFELESGKRYLSY